MDDRHILGGYTQVMGGLSLIRIQKLYTLRAQLLGMDGGDFGAFGTAPDDGDGDGLVANTARSFGSGFRKTT